MLRSTYFAQNYAGIIRQGLTTRSCAVLLLSEKNAGEQLRIHLGRDTLSRMVPERLREVPLRGTWFSWDARLLW